MARQDNPFALLSDDDEGDDVSVLLAKVEAKMPALTPLATEQTKQKNGPNGFPSKPQAPSEFVRGDRGRGRGGRSRGIGRGGFGNVGGSDAIDQPEHLYDRDYSAESGGERSRGRGGRGGMGRGRGRGFTGFGNMNQMDYGNLGDGEEGVELQEKGYYGDSRPTKYDTRSFVEENQVPDGEERENLGFRGYGADRENRGFRGHGSDVDKREFRDGEGYQRKREFRDGEGYKKSYGGDGENRGFRSSDGENRGFRSSDGENRGFRSGDGENRGFRSSDGDNRGFRSSDGENRGFRSSDGENRGFRSSDGENRGFRSSDGENRGFRSSNGENRGFRSIDGENRGFRGSEGRGGGYGGRGWRGGRDGGRGGGRYESNDGWNASETKKDSADEKETTVDNTNNGDGGAGRDDDHIAIEEPAKDGPSEKLMPEPIVVSEDTSKVPEEDNEMTLAEYEKLLQEKRKALESLKTETRKVVLDKDFEGMLIIEKKKEDDLTKAKAENDKGKKKEIIEREDKSRKSQSINEFLKPADGERYRGPASSSRGRGGGRGRGRGGYITDYPRQAAASSAAAAPSLEDPSHFPILGAAAKA